MSWAAWVLVVFCVLQVVGICVQVAWIGKPRKPTTATEMAYRLPWSLAFLAFYIYLIWRVR